MPVTGCCRISKSFDELNFFLDVASGFLERLHTRGLLIWKQVAVTVITVARQEGRIAEALRLDGRRASSGASVMPNRSGEFF
jgi:hypothetical protein